MNLTDHDQIIMKGMVLHGHVGLYESEKENGQDFIVDVTLTCPLLEACKSDRIEQTIDYGRAYQMIASIVENAHFDLIERLADEIAGRLLDEFKLAGIAEVTVSKPNAPIPGKFTAMSVRIKRERS